MINKDLSTKFLFSALATVVVISSILVSCNESPYMQGKRLYDAKCQNCHMEDGSGLSLLIPSLSSSVYLGNVHLACILKNGIRDTIFKDSTFLIKEMPSFSRLSATEVTNIINYIDHRWKEPFKEISILEVENQLINCD